MLSNNLVEEQEFCGYIADEKNRNRALANIIALKTAFEFFEKCGLTPSVEFAAHKIKKVFEELDISDLYIGDLRLDIRLGLTSQDIFLVPRKHYEYGVMPDLYMFVNYDTETGKVDIAGFLKPDNIDKSLYDDYYYIIPRNTAHFANNIEELFDSCNIQAKEGFPLNSKKKCILYLDNQLLDIKEFYRELMLYEKVRKLLLDYCLAEDIIRACKLSVSAEDITDEKPAVNQEVVIKPVVIPEEVNLGYADGLAPDGQNDEESVDIESFINGEYADIDSDVNNSDNPDDGELQIIPETMQLPEKPYNEEGISLDLADDKSYTETVTVSDVDESDYFAIELPKEESPAADVEDDEPAELDVVNNLVDIEPDEELPSIYEAENNRLDSVPLEIDSPQADDIESASIDLTEQEPERDEDIPVAADEEQIIESKPDEDVVTISEDALIKNEVLTEQVYEPEAEYEESVSDEEIEPIADDSEEELGLSEGFEELPEEPVSDEEIEPIADDSEEELGLSEGFEELPEEPVSDEISEPEAEYEESVSDEEIEPIADDSEEELGLSEGFEELPEEPVSDEISEPEAEYEELSVGTQIGGEVNSEDNFELNLPDGPLDITDEGLELLEIDAGDVQPEDITADSDESDLPLEPVEEFELPEEDALNDEMDIADHIEESVSDEESSTAQFDTDKVPPADNEDSENMTFSEFAEDIENINNDMNTTSQEQDEDEQEEEEPEKVYDPDFVPDFAAGEFKLVSEDGAGSLPEPEQPQITVSQEPESVKEELPVTDEAVDSDESSVEVLDSELEQELNVVQERETEKQGLDIQAALEGFVNTLEPSQAIAPGAIPSANAGDKVNNKEESVEPSEQVSDKDSAKAAQEASEEIDGLYSDDMDVEPVIEQPLRKKKKQPSKTLVGGLFVLLIALGIAGFISKDSLLGNVQSNTQAESVPNELAAPPEKRPSPPKKDDIETEADAMLEDIEEPVQLLDTSVSVAAMTVDCDVPSFMLNTHSRRYLIKLVKRMQLQLKNSLLLSGEQPLANKLVIDLSVDKDVLKYEKVSSSSGSKKVDEIAASTAENVLRSTQPYAGTFGSSQGIIRLVVKF